jgi:hypothetical protein
LGKKHRTCLPIKAKPASRPGSGLVHTERSESSKSSETSVFRLVASVAVVVVVVVVVSVGDTGSGNDDDSFLLLLLEEETTDKVFPDERKRSATTQPFLIRNADPPVQLFVLVFAVATASGIFVFIFAVATAIGVFGLVVVVRGGGGAIAAVSPLFLSFLLVLLALADDDVVVDDNALGVSFPFCLSVEDIAILSPFVPLFLLVLLLLILTLVGDGDDDDDNVAVDGAGFSVEDLTGFGLLERTVGAILRCRCNALCCNSQVETKATATRGATCANEDLD